MNEAQNTEETEGKSESVEIERKFNICVFFFENHNQLHRFAAICSFLDCVQCVFNVAFTVCSLYVQCQLPPET